MHGTSVRYGNVIKEYPLNAFQKWINNLFKRNIFNTKKVRDEFLGTRNVILQKTKDGKYIGGYYGDGEPYSHAAKLLKGKLKPDEVVYGELVGYTSDGKPLFFQNIGGHRELADLAKQIGSTKMDYHYGCKPGQCAFYVYRITQNGVDLTWEQLQQRAKELEVNTVPLLAKIVYYGNKKEQIDETIEVLSEGIDPIGKTHLREGVCIRTSRLITVGKEVVEHKPKIYKQKGYWFRLLEGIIKDKEDYVDLEEIA
jgi:hypothetical protein